MPDLFTPRLEILPPAQRRLWAELGDVPAGCTLYGGTAIALHLGHRQSIDFDFFTRRPLDPDTLIRHAPFMRGAEITQIEPDTFSATLDRAGAVKVSFFSVPHLPRLAPALIAADNRLAVASLQDLAGTKAKVVLQRAEAKDYLDIEALMKSGGVDLPTAVACAQAMYGQSYSPQSTLKALCYFGDGDLPRLPQEVKDRLASAARAVDLDQLPAIRRLPDDGIASGLDR